MKMQKNENGEYLVKMDDDADFDEDLNEGPSTSRACWEQTAVVEELESD